MTELSKSERWRRRHPERAFMAGRKSKIKEKFGMSWDEYLQLEALRGQICWICGTNDPGRGRRSMCVDHCHTTGKVRGLLCFGCNEAIGRFKDDPVLLEAAAVYLEKSMAVEGVA